MKKLFIIIGILTVISCLVRYVVYQKEKVSTQDSVAVRDVAVNFFQACSAGDWAKAKQYGPSKYVDLLKTLVPLEGLQIINIGEPAKRHLWYPGLFVPYEIKFKSGETKKYFLAVRNDNSAHIWQVDGGI